MNSLVTTIRIGLLRSGLELKQFLRQRESVVFTLFFPVILLFIFGTVFKDTIAPGVTFSQYFVAGMIASGLVNTGFQQLAITIPMERDDGTLKRLRGTPCLVNTSDAADDLTPSDLCGLAYINTITDTHITVDKET